MTGHPVIGILGGMGPEATLNLMRRVIDATPARDDSDHIHMIVDHNPKVPSRMAALIEGTGENPAPVLAGMAQGLETGGAHALAMPCNSAHAYLPDIRSAVSIPVLDMIELTATAVADLSPAPKRVGILASSAVNMTGLYVEALDKHGIPLIVPARQDDLMAVIRAVKRADLSDDIRGTMDAMMHDLVNTGADTLLLACTELSVLAGRTAGDVPVIDALDVLSREIVSFGRGRTRHRQGGDATV